MAQSPFSKLSSDFSAHESYHVGSHNPEIFSCATHMLVSTETMYEYDCVGTWWVCVDSYVKTGYC